MSNNNQTDYAACGAALKAEIAKGLTRRQKLLGIWNRTIPRWLDAGSGVSLRTFLVHAIRLAVTFLIPATPFLSKRIFTTSGKPEPTTPNDVAWMLALLVATLYAWWFDRVRSAKSSEKLTARKAAALLLDSAGTITALRSVLVTQSDLTVTSAEYRQHLQRVLKRIHTEVGLLLNAREETFGQVTLLLYGSNDGTELQVVARSTDASAPLKKLAAHKLMAHYVAQTGRDWVEHDFRRRLNLFPKTRLTTPGQIAEYRSILFKPLLIGVDGGATEQLFCRGILCIHSDRPYQFWKLGDGDANRDVLLLRLAPYFALLELLLEKWPYKVATDPVD